MDQDEDAFEEREDELEARISENPDDGRALRDLGAIYVRTGRPSEAYDTLKEAFARRPDDPKVLFYLGVASEKLGRREEAIDLFSDYDQAPADSKFRTLMRGRYEWLVQQQARRNVRQMIATEQQRDLTEAVSPRTVAVMPFAYAGGDDRYQPLSRGLAELLTTDLANVGRIQVVERVRLQALLDELKLAQSEYVDPSTAPRIGRLLGAGRLVGGTYSVAGDEQIRLQVTLAELATGDVSTPSIEEQSGTLEDLFALQKQVAFSVVDRLGIELTPQEKAAIQEVPTQSLQAFLAFSRGLQEEARGNYGAATTLYRQAQQIDPDFEAPARRQQEAQSIQAGGGSPDQALASASGGGQQGGQQAGGGGLNLVNQRLQSMGAGTSALQGDGTDRDPAQEAGNAETDSELDAPPPPPPTGGGSEGSGN